MKNSHLISVVVIFCLVSVSFGRNSNYEIMGPNERIGKLFKHLGMRTPGVNGSVGSGDSARKRFALGTAGHRVKTLNMGDEQRVAMAEVKNKTLTIAIILPHTNFGVREYKRVTNAAINNLHRGRGQRFEFLKKYQFGSEQVKSTMMTLTPSPTGIYSSFRGFVISEKY